MNDVIHKKVAGFFAGYPVRKLAKGEILLFANEDPPGIYHVSHGQIGQYDITAKGQQVMVNIFKQPAFFPMSWAINGTPNQYLYEALDDAVVHEAPAADVLTFLEENPDVLLNLLARVYRGTDGLLRRTALLMEGDAHTRLLFELVVSCLRFGIQAGGGYKLAITEAQVAARTGLARETVSRQLKQMREQKLLMTSPGHLVIPDIEKLREALQESGVNL